MLESQFQLEATRDTIDRGQIRGFVIQEVDFIGNETTTGIADNSPGTPGEMDTRKLPLRSSLVTLISERKRTCKKPISHRWFRHGQNNLQTRKSMLTQTHSDRVEVRLQNEIKPAIRRTSAREQQPLFEYRF